MERFSPLLKGDSVCGSKQQGIVKLFFQAEAPFLLVLQKKWGCICIKAERSSLFLTVKRADSIRPYIFICSFWCEKIACLQKLWAKKQQHFFAKCCCFRWDFIFFFKNQRRLSLLQGEVTFGFSSTFAEEESSSSIFSESGIALWQRGQR